jgi:hypothetical protein
MNNRFSTSIFLLLTLFGTSGSFAAIFDRNGSLLPDSQALSDAVNWRYLDSSDKITGVGVLSAPIVGDICTGFLVKTDVSNGPAYVITNGHCNFFAHYGFDMLGAKEFRINRQTDYKITFFHRKDVPEKERVTYQLRRIVYITEHLTDLGIFELQSEKSRSAATLKELASRGIQGLKLSQRKVKQGESARLVGTLLFFPGMDWWDHSVRTVRLSPCRLQETVELKNGAYSAPQSVVHQCSSLPGFSGGPLLDERGEVVLLNSHGNTQDSKDPDCSYETKPCEVLSDGTFELREDRNYGQRVDGIASCFNKSGVFDLSATECLLPK